MTDQDRPAGRPTEEEPKVKVTDRRGLEDEPAPVADDLQQLADDRLDQLMRLKADFENFRKRELREKTELIERASQRLAEKILPVLDDLERALAAAKTHATDATAPPEPLLRGVELVAQKLHGVLADEGLEQIEASGPFDPEHHEAVASVPGDVSEPTVLEVVRPGYKIKGKTIRPALVQVAVPDTESG